jgi:hypothetical protein
MPQRQLALLVPILVHAVMDLRILLLLRPQECT